MPAFSSLELIQAHRWSRLFFTTYALSLSFFEAVVLERIVRQQIGSCSILADVFGVRTAMDEVGAHGAGRTYDIEPVAVKNGCFHPKLLALLSDDEAGLVIGSGNLTFGGWGSNLECAEYLHPSFAPDAFNDTAGFLEALALTEEVKHSAQDECIEIADELRNRVRGLKPNPHIRVLHSIGPSILEQIEGLASELGGAARIVIASPFFDHLGVIDICKRLKVTQANVHSHDGGTVLGSAGSNWPSCSPSRVQAIRLEFLREEKPRLLHAKMYEIGCRRGRIVISGSPNSTDAGLGLSRNVELCVARIQRDQSPRWSFSKAHPPVPTPALPEDKVNGEDQATVAILRATLEGGKVRGRVISYFPEGKAFASRKEGLSWVGIETTTVNSDGDFYVDMPGGWQKVWSGQVLLRLLHEPGALAQGFVSLPELREISRRLGSSAPHFFSFLQGKETPADVEAILNYICQNPEWLPKSQTPELSSSHPGTVALDDPLVNIEELLAVENRGVNEHSRHEGKWQGWQQFMQDVFAAFREPRGKFEPVRAIGKNKDSPDPEADDDADTEDERIAADTIKALASFDRLLRQILGAPRESRHLVKALTIAQYVCERLDLERVQVRTYLDRILKGFEPAPRGDAECNLFVAATLLWAAHLDGEFTRNAAQLRRNLLRGGCSLSEDVPDLAPLKGFIGQLAKADEIQKLWRAAMLIRTVQEEAKSFWNGTGPRDRKDFPRLSLVPEWEILKNGPSARIHRLTVFGEYCPTTYMGLPMIQASRLSEGAVATCTCGKVLLCEEI